MLMSSKAANGPEGRVRLRDTKSDTRRNTVDTDRHQHIHTETHEH